MPKTLHTPLDTSVAYAKQTAKLMTKNHRSATTINDKTLRTKLREMWPGIVITKPLWLAYRDDARKDTSFPWRFVPRCDLPGKHTRYLGADPDGIWKKRTSRPSAYRDDGAASLRESALEAFGDY